MNTSLTIPPSLLFLQAEIPLCLPGGIILLSGLIMCLQLYLAGKKKPLYSAGENEIREEQSSGFLSGYLVVYLIYRRIRGRSDLEIIAMGPVRFPGQVSCPESSMNSPEDIHGEAS
ncbi:MAG: hypothetical protein AB2L24_09515 [Mangrovibacterium sp.]